MEEFLIETTDRFTLFPIKYHDVWESYKNHKKAFWTAEEIDFSADRNDWEKLSDNEKYFIENILGFFAGSDGIVLENLMGNFSTEIQNAEMRCFYMFQGMMENIHSECYSLLIDSLVTPKSRQRELFRAISDIPCVEQKAEWAQKWLDPSKASFSHRLIAFAVVEGIFFSGSFCAIFWLKSRGKMCNSLGKANELIARDESLHTQFATMVYRNHVVNKLSREQVLDIVLEAVAIETDFICDSLPCSLIGMNSEMMTEYIKYVCDLLLIDLGYDKHYHAENPFPFMVTMSLDGQTNFFESRVSEYQKNAIEESDKHFILSDDF
jgi:ribonucleotide reductase beta subunit family protein with ferritin-like domain